MVQQTEKFSNLQAYFERAIPQIIIAVNHEGETVAWVPSTNSNDPYTVWIDESSKVSHAVKCSCNDHWYRKSYCRHMQAADLYFQRIASFFAHDEQATEPEVEQPAGVEVNALLLKNRELYRSGKWNESGQLTPVSEVMPNEYDILGPTKKVSHAYGCCGNIVKVEDAGELCGPCRCK